MKFFMQDPMLLRELWFKPYNGQDQQSFSPFQESGKSSKINLKKSVKANQLCFSRYLLGRKDMARKK
jgi:hypothetical protein